MLCRASLLLVVLLFACGESEKKKADVVEASAPAPIETSAPLEASTPSATASTPSPPATVPDAIAAQHVLIAYKGAKNAPKSVTRSKADAQKRAQEVVTKARGGEDFSALVAEYSDDPAAKERQGSLGKFTRDKMVKPFSDAAFALAVNAISDPVETPFGFHVIKRNQ